MRAFLNKRLDDQFYRCRPGNMQDHNGSEEEQYFDKDSISIIYRSRDFTFVGAFLYLNGPSCEQVFWLDRLWSLHCIWCCLHLANRNWLWHLRLAIIRAQGLLISTNLARSTSPFKTPINTTSTLMTFHPFPFHDASKPSSSFALLPTRATR